MSTTAPAIAESLGVPTAHDETELAQATMRRVSVRLLPFLTVLYLFNTVDRTNLAIAALHMNRDLGFSATAYGFGAGIFFVGYGLFEIPSNLILARVGARRWIARIAITWGLISSAMMFVRTPAQFYVLRVLLGIAEAGMMPGVIYYLTLWFPTRERGVATARFMLATALAGFVGNTLGAWIMGFEGRLGLHGWQWLFLLEGIPSLALGIVALGLLADRPENARWLSDQQRQRLIDRMRRDALESAAPHSTGALRVLAHPVVWLLAVTDLLTSVPMWAYTFWAPNFVRDELHTSTLATGTIVGTIALVASGAMLWSGSHSDRTRERCLHASAGAALMAAGCAGAALLPNPFARVGAFAFIEIGVRIFVPPFLCLTPMLLRGAAAAAGIALVNTVFSVGGVVGPFFVGRFKDAHGSTNGAFLPMAGLSLGAAVLCVVLRVAVRIERPAAHSADRIAALSTGAFQSGPQAT
jgi:ACS family tartrate transporter-like MFS transporter